MRRGDSVRLLGASAAVSAGWSRRWIASAATPLPVRVATAAVDSAAQVLYAQELGYFEEAGLDVKLTVPANASGSVLLAALLGNELDICPTSCGPLITARGRGINVRFFCPGAIFTGPDNTASLMVAADAPIRSAADLVGKTVAVAGLRDIVQYCVQGWLDSARVDAAAVRYLEIPYPAMGAALVAGRVDAMCALEPFITQAKPAARVLAQLDPVIGKRFLRTGWMATSEWPSQNPDARARFGKAMQRASRWANGHHRESGAILAKYSKIEQATVSAMTRSRYDESDRIDARLLQDPLRIMIRYNGAPATLTVNDLFWALG
jgi:NitT/TauT family transport system substrate-binding protein